jgi:hypothetical protein
MFESKMLRKLFGTNDDEDNKGGDLLSDEGLSNSYRLPVNVIMWHAVRAQRNVLEGSYLEDQEEGVKT